MLFSVVIPCFNRLPYLPQALSSVWSQTFTDYEVIVADDGSTDGTAEYLSTLTPPVRVVRQPNAGPGAARNAGIAVATGEYIAFLDSDDLWFPWTLATMAEAIRTHERPTLVAGRVIQFAGSSPDAEVADALMEVSVFGDYLASARHALLFGSNSAVVRRDAVLANGGFTDRRINGEDADLFLRLGLAPGFVSIVAPVTIAWRRHPESATHSLSLSVVGANYVVEQEHHGRYPGGGGRAAERREIITRFARPISFACLRGSAITAGLRLYCAMFVWHLQLGRWRYLGAFPLIAIWELVRPLNRERSM